jgi:opacity protein-like surface antigen
MLSGMSFSDYHGNTYSGRWQTKTGVLSGLFFRYSFNPVLAVGTELNYSVQVYRHKPYTFISPSYYYGPYYAQAVLSYTWFPGDLYYPDKEQWDFSFLRIPLYLTLSTPTRLQFSVSAGVFLSFILHHEYTGQVYYPYPWYSCSMYPVYQNSHVPAHDNGLVYAASLSYPVSDVFRVYILGRYFIGHKPFIGANHGRTGASEMTFGFAYTGPFRSGKASGTTLSKRDSAFARCLINPHAGLNISWFREDDPADRYGSRTGFSAAVWMEYRFDKSVSVVSGLGFDRRGYRMDDSSIYFYRHAAATWPLYKVDTRVDLDYAVIPLLLKIRIGSGIKAYFSGGPYLGIKLNARVTGTAEIEDFSEYGYARSDLEVYDDLENLFRNTDAGWMIGTGVEIPFSKGSFLDLGLHYTAGRKNILDKNKANDGSLIESDNLIRNGSVALQIGFAIPILTSK